MSVDTAGDAFGCRSESLFQPIDDLLHQDGTEFAVNIWMSIRPSHHAVIAVEEGVIFK